MLNEFYYCLSMYLYTYRYNVSYLTNVKLQANVYLSIVYTFELQKEPK